MKSCIRINLTQMGFSLTELVLCLLIIAIMAAFILPRFQDWRANLRVKSAARELYSNMQNMRILAVKTNIKTAIIFDPMNNKYSLCSDWSGTVCNSILAVIDLKKYGSNVRYGHGTASIQANSSGSSFPLTPDDNVSYSSPDNIAVFNGNGLGSSGYVYFENAITSTTYAIGSMASGVIKLLKWQGISWK